MAWTTIARLRVEGANAAANPAALGSLPITSLAGALNAGLRAQGAGPPAALIFRVHEIAPQLVGPGLVPTHQGRVGVCPKTAKKEERGMTCPNDPDPRMDFAVSLGVETSARADAPALAAALRRAPCCGGRVLATPRIATVHGMGDALDGLATTGPGMMLVDRTERMLARAREIDDSALAALIDLLAEGAVPPRRRMALGTGFRMLSRPTPKAAARSPEVPHALAEPILGYGELHGLSDAEAAEMALVWRPAISSTTGYCLMKGATE